MVFYGTLCTVWVPLFLQMAKILCIFKTINYASVALLFLGMSVKHSSINLFLLFSDFLQLYFKQG